MKLVNKKGMVLSFLENGSLKDIDVTPIRIGMQAGSPYNRAGAQIYLRKRSGSLKFTPLTGPESPTSFVIRDHQFSGRGNWEGLEYSITLVPAEDRFAWLWLVELINYSGQDLDADLVYVQDIGLKPAINGLNNEYYISQYLERTILDDEEHGKILCCRQNMKEKPGYPFVLIASGKRAESACTDSMQFYGKSYRQTGVPEALLQRELGGEMAGEGAVLALQEQPFLLRKGEAHSSSFLGIYLPDHPEAISQADRDLVKDTLSAFEGKIRAVGTDQLRSPAVNLFNSAPFLPVEELSEQELRDFFGSDWRHVERSGSSLLSFFTGDGRHVVLREKEVLVDRPHAHIMQAKAGFKPEETVMSTTSFAFGVFNSHITQGNTNFTTLLSVCTSQFNTAPESGQRIFALLNDTTYLLGIPSAFEIGLNHCRWIYKTGSGILQVRTWTSKKQDRIITDIRVLKGKPVRFILSHQFDTLNNWSLSQGTASGEFVLKPAAESMIADKFPEAGYRILVEGAVYRSGGEELLYTTGTVAGFPLFVIETEPLSSFLISFSGEVTARGDLAAIGEADRAFKADCHDGQKVFGDLCMQLELGGQDADSLAIREILPWYAMNALTHYLTPYGLEQFSGAAWGTRDVAQGPFDLLLGMGKYDEAKEVLLTIFSNQNPDGGWPQWWMFDSFRDIRADHSHGDVYYWCIIALSSYIGVTGDSGILDTVLPYYLPAGSPVEESPLREHMERLIKMITDSFIPGTSLVPYGGGDWNDSLQPVSHDLAARMVSSWTVEMNFQAFSQYRHVYELAGEKEKAVALGGICRRIRDDFNRYLVRDGVVAGYGMVEDDGTFDVLLHPADKMTGIRYSVLPMDRGVISGIFTAEQAEVHQELVEKHLKGPDGARLMDRPLKYRGGIQTIFQRAESSTFFGREIGLMYIHEHIRYAEALAITGKAEGFVRALRQAIPVDYRKVVPCSDYRQSNCYYSSSDVTFKSRYEADERYEEVLSGKMLLKGGWRVYSSGPGIFITLVVSRLLGLRTLSGQLIIDPVLPASMDGMSASLSYDGYPLKLEYRVKKGNHSPRALTLNGKSLEFTAEENPYRKGGAQIPLEKFREVLQKESNTLLIEL